MSSIAASYRVRWARRLTSRWPGGWIIAWIVVGLGVLGTVAAPLLAPHNPDTVDLSNIYAAPSSAHLLGGDAVGRDLLSRLMYGGRITLLVPLLVVICAGVAGTVLALLSAWHGRWVDYVIARTFDVTFAFPGILLAILATAVFGAGVTTMTVALAIAYTPYIGRVIRSEAIRQRHLPYIAAIDLQGGSRLTLALRHLLPNLSQLVLAQLTLAYGYALLDAATLSFLGLGIQPPTPDWGVMVSEGQSGITGGHPQESLYAGGLIVIFVVAVTVIGSRLGDRAEAGQS